ncbi:HK97 gp10 family phage protein [Terribacillus saccharophilus]|jgi:hypothetical protein|uniref:Phage protein, HK97 gp10 family n=1 Tax=Terribacillus saccharophilus TaxID=361277 RepID=A0ABX4H0E6_9BACI|nr:HK97 gp10 family phage protein [Terribacillus saccharophilus]PAD35977.1 hypothetical protein CHH56_06000 [Terribacillus saccharophilus]PAD96973.1 hypothetical protein CHH50_06310 [Terribacillus saccharophilus]PAE00549.1 hypothetical protein CHH48_07215 [Terribacillus saccharophilus]
MKFKVTSSDDNKLIKALGRSAADELRREIDITVEEHTRSMADGASDNAPVLTGALRDSIPRSVDKVEDMVWLFGSEMPYAQRQEYEHRSHSAYFRRAIWAGETPLKKALIATVDRSVGR